VNLMAKNMKDFDVSNEILSEHWLPVHVCMCASVVARACVRLSGKVPRVKVRCRCLQGARCQQQRLLFQARAAPGTSMSGMEAVWAGGCWVRLGAHVAIDCPVSRTGLARRQAQACGV